jgi:hypothetical protein
VTVVSTIRSQPPMVADELRREADSFVELQDLIPDIQRAHAPRRDGDESPRHSKAAYEEV